MISSNQAATKSNSKTRKGNRTSKQDKRMSERRLKGGHFDSDHSPGPQINNKPLTEKYAVQLETQSAIVDNNEMTLHEAANPEQLAAFNKHEE